MRYRSENIPKEPVGAAPKAPKAPVPEAWPGKPPGKPPAPKEPLALGKAGMFVPEGSSKEREPEGASC